MNTALAAGTHSVRVTVKHFEPAFPFPREKTILAYASANVP